MNRVNWRGQDYDTFFLRLLIKVFLFLFTLIVVIDQVAIGLIVVERVNRSFWNGFFMVMVMVSR